MDLFKFFSALKSKLYVLKKKLTFTNIISKFSNIILYFLYWSEIKILLFFVLKRLNLTNDKNPKTPIFLYDIRARGLTFDFADDLFLANIWLNKMGFEKCECVISAIKDEYIPMKFRSYNLLFTKDELLQRVDNILKPLAESANFITKTYVVSDRKTLDKILRKSFIVFPPHYISLKKYNLFLSGIPLNVMSTLIRDKATIYPFINFLEPDLKAVNAVKKSLKISALDKIVTFTIRDYKFDSIRNTNYKFVNALSSFFKSNGYRFIVIPDHKNPNPNIEEDIYSDATIDTKKRIAIYNLAKINIGTAGGPLWMVKNMPGVNMFLTNVGLKGNHIGSYSDLRRFFGKEFKWGKQPFLEFDLHLIYGPEGDIKKLISNKRLKQIMSINKST